MHQGEETMTIFKQYGEERSGTNFLKRLIEILRQAQYRGYVALEYEAAEDPMKVVPRHAAALSKLMSS